MLPTDTDVLIVGAGPTGLALANVLQQSGVNHVIVDALSEGLNTSRAAVVHAHTLEMLDRIGVVGELNQRGVDLSRFVIRDEDQVLLEISFDDLPSAFQKILMIPQPATENVLATRLSATGGKVHRGVQAVGVSQSNDFVGVQLEGPDGKHSLRAKFVVAGDGMHSIIRQSTSIAFEGAPYAESFVLADVRMDWPLIRNDVSLFFSAAGLVVVAPLPDGSFRIVATMDKAPAEPGIDDIQALLDARGPQVRRARVEEIVWSSRFRVHHRLASAYREGRILLMGDAAHVHSPAGGQGMNTGLVDAIVLGEALTAVVRRDASPSALDQYAALRRPAAAHVLTLASRLTNLATIRSPILRALRNLALRTVNHVPTAKRAIALQLSGVSRRHLATPLNEVRPRVAIAKRPSDLTADKRVLEPAS